MIPNNTRRQTLFSQIRWVITYNLFERSRLLGCPLWSAAWACFDELPSPFQGYLHASSASAVRFDKIIKNNCLFRYELLFCLLLNWNPLLRTFLWCPLTPSCPLLLDPQAYKCLSSKISKSKYNNDTSKHHRPPIKNIEWVVPAATFLTLPADGGILTRIGLAESVVTPWPSCPSLLGK